MVISTLQMVLSSVSRQTATFFVSPLLRVKLLIYIFEPARALPMDAKSIISSIPVRFNFQTVLILLFIVMI